MKYQYFNGVKFTKDDDTGYYLNSTIRERLHRYVWEFYNGKIPKGYQIHHIDGNKDNNDISNLQLMSFSEHAQLHSNEKVKNNYDRVVANLINNAIPKALEWHKSKAGRQWHKEHYNEMKDKLYVKVEFVCENCGEKYIGYKNGSNRFCSGKCKAQYRRKSGVDNVKRICVVCGKEFECNKYSDAKTCNRKCRYQLRTLK